MTVRALHEQPGRVAAYLELPDLKVHVVPDLATGKDFVIISRHGTMRRYQYALIELRRILDDLIEDTERKLHADWDARSGSGG